MGSAACIAAPARWASGPGSLIDTESGPTLSLAQYFLNALDAARPPLVARTAVVAPVRVSSLLLVVRRLENRHDPDALACLDRERQVSSELVVVQSRMM